LASFRQPAGAGERAGRVSRPQRWRIRLAGERRRKSWIGGTIWYLDSQLIGYGLQVAVDNTVSSARLQPAQAMA
jgi:hypothetical protein